MLKASIVIPTYNKLPRLKLMLTSLFNQSCSWKDFEVIIIDDGSMDGTRDFIKNCSFPPNFVYVLKENEGRAAARNEGARLAKNEILIFCDDDMILPPCFIECHLEAQKQQKSVIHGKIKDFPYLKFFADPTKGLFYQNYISENDRYKKIRKLCFSPEDILFNFKNIIKYSKENSMDTFSTWIYKKGFDQFLWMSLMGANISLPKCWFEKAGGFDENFGLEWGCEDIELGYRLKHIYNFPFVYKSECINYHMVHLRNEYAKEHSNNANYFWRKYKDEAILMFNRYACGEITLDELKVLILAMKKEKD